MADHPLPTAESIASQPKPKPRAPAGSSSAITVQTSTVSTPRKNLAITWQVVKVAMDGARAVAKVARV
ncbi:MAG TPA: hypothetical protein VF933_05045 [Streptosporangiaceae bacterium]